MPTLYQQGTQRIEIIVKKMDGNGVAGAKQLDSNEVTNENVANKGGGQTGGRSQRIKRRIITNTTHALAVAKQAASYWINWIVGGVGYRYGDEALQDLAQQQVDIAQDATNFASSVAMGVVFGAWGGPIGAIVGGTLGAVQSGMSLMSKYGNRERDFTFKVFKENNAIEYRRARASINLTTGRLR